MAQAREHLLGDKRFVEAICNQGRDGEPCGNCWNCILGDREVVYSNGHRFLEHHEVSGEFICTSCGVWKLDDQASEQCKGG